MRLWRSLRCASNLLRDGVGVKVSASFRWIEPKNHRRSATLVAPSVAPNPFRLLPNIDERDRVSASEPERLAGCLAINERSPPDARPYSCASATAAASCATKRTATARFENMRAL